MQFNRETFFGLWRKRFGSLKQTQVVGLEFLLGKFEKEERLVWLEQVAYILATVYHETAATMQPIREYHLGKGKAYGKPEGKYNNVYYGRGYVQITWGANYEKMGRLLNQPLFKSPDLALEPEISYNIMIEGMLRGLFTGHSLDRYINEERKDYIGARRVVNGTDKAKLIAGYAKWCENTLRSAAEG